jgi:hypothetical protein
MSRPDDHVIPYEEAVRRRRALEEAQRHKGVIREVKISDAMSHLLEKSLPAEGEGPTPARLREIVEREFAEGEQCGEAHAEGTGDEPEDAPFCGLGGCPARKDPS